VDGLAGDPHKVWNWSLAEGKGSMAWCVKNVLGWEGKKLILGGGNDLSVTSNRLDFFIVISMQVVIIPPMRLERMHI
jgi:hypothetical protein